MQYPTRKGNKKLRQVPPENVYAEGFGPESGLTQLLKNSPSTLSAILSGTVTTILLLAVFWFWGMPQLAWRSAVDSRAVISQVTTTQLSTPIAGSSQPIQWLALVDANALPQPQHLVKLPSDASGIAFHTFSSNDQAQSYLSNLKSKSPPLTLQGREQLAGVFPGNLFQQATHQLARISHYWLSSIYDQASQVTQQSSNQFSGLVTGTSQGQFVDLRAQSVKNQVVAITYQTPTPIITEKNVDFGKLVTVSAQNETAEVTGVIAHTTIPKIYKVGQETHIHIAWENNGNQNVQFTPYDLNHDGYIDYVEWMVPHLSLQTYEVIFISHALRLAPDKHIIEDIYDQVYQKDNHWASLENGQYARITFEHPLTQKNDITLYAKPTDPTQSAKVMVYLKDSNKLITTFNAIDHEGFYRVILKNITQPTDTFDLKISGNLDVDYITDPTVTWDGGGGDNNWDTCANWTNDTCPTSSDSVIFDGTSTKDVTINVDVTVADFNISSGYTGTITQSANLTVSNFSQATGTFTGGASNLTINGNFTLSGGTFTAPSSGTFGITKSFTQSGSPTFNANGGTVTFNGTIDSDTSIDASGVTFNIITINRTVSYSNGRTLTIASGTTIPLGSSPVLTLDRNGGAGYNLTNNGTITTTASGTWSPIVSGILTNNGTITATSITGLTFTGDLVNSGTVTMTNVSAFIFSTSSNHGATGSITNNSGATLTSASNPTFNMNGSFIVNSSSTFPANVTLTMDQSLPINSTSIDASGYTFVTPVTINRTIVGDSNQRTLTIVSGTTIPLGNSPTLTLNVSSGGGTYNLTNNGTITVGTGTWTVNVDGDFTNTGTVSAASIGSLVFDGNLVNNGTFTVTGISAFNFDALSSNGFGSFTNNSGATFSSAANPTFNIEGSFIVSSSSTFPASATLTMDGTKERSSNIDASGYVFVTPVTINRTAAGSNQPVLTIASGTTIPLGDSPTLTLIDTGGGTYNLTNNGTITVGTGTWTATVNDFTNNATISTSASTIDFHGNFTNAASASLTAASNPAILVAKNLTINSSSTFPTTLGSITFDGTSGTQTVSASTITNWGDFSKTAGSSLTLPSSNMTVGSITFSGGTINNPGSATTMFASGNISQSSTGTFGGTNLTIELNGTGNQTISKTAGTFSSLLKINRASETAGTSAQLSTAFATSGTSATTTVTAGTFSLNGQSFTSGGTFTIQSGGTLQLFGSETPTTPTLNAGSTVKFTGNGNSSADTYTITNLASTYSNLTINSTDGATDIFKLGAATTVNNNLNVIAGDLSLNGQSLSVTGSFTVQNGAVLQLFGSETPTTPTLNAGSTVKFTGNGNSSADTYTITNLASTYSNLTINSTDGATDIFKLGAALTVNGNLTNTAGTFDVDSTGNYAINLAGNWSNSGTFNARTGTVTLNGTNQKVFGATTFYNFTKDISSANADTLMFQNTKTQTIAANGTLTLKGAVGKILTLRSSDASGTETDGTQWQLSVNSSGTTIAVSYVDVKDSDASSGHSIRPSFSTNSLNNLNWVFNTAPSISADPSDGGSYSGAPTDVGSDVSFTGTGTDTESDNYYLAICKTNSITANANAAPTCNGGNWCVSGSTTSGLQASCNYTTLSGDAESNAWYAFVCDNATDSLCSVSSQGLGNSGSPFSVNHAPSFSAISTSGSPATTGANVTFNATASDSDTDGTSDTVTLYVCKANDFTGTVCGAGGEWCHASGANSDPSCNYTIQAGDSEGTINYYASIIDNHNFGSSSNPRSGTFVIDKTAPITTASGNGYTFNTWTNSSVTVSLTCDDGSGSGCNITKYCTDTANSCSPTTTYSGNVLISTTGISYIRYFSTDNASNAESTQSQTIKINSAPSFSVDPSDGGSYSGSPTSAGNDISFTATATDNEGDNYYLAVCKTNAVTANNNATPTCPGGSWAISNANASGVQASATYTTSSGDVESNDWYAFVCDDNNSALCSSVSQGSGNNGSPFAVNHAPNFTAISASPDPVLVGSQITFSSTASDPDSGNTVSLYVCKFNDFTGSVCGSEGEWCHSSAANSDPSCSHTMQAGDVGPNNYYGYIVDNFNLESAADPMQSSFTVTQPPSNNGGGSHGGGNAFGFSGGGNNSGGNNGGGGKNGGTIIVNVTTVGGRGTFNFKTKGAGFNDFVIDAAGNSGSHTQSNLAPGVYSADEIVPSDWIKTEDTCGSLTVTDNATTTCSIINVKANSKKGTIMVMVNTIGGDRTFNFKTKGPGYGKFSVTTHHGLGYNIQTNLVSKNQTYSAIETVPSGWVKTKDTCGSLVVTTGTITTCTVTNQFNGNTAKNPPAVPPPKGNNGGSNGNGGGDNGSSGGGSTGNSPGNGSGSSSSGGSSGGTTSGSTSSGSGTPSSGNGVTGSNGTTTETTTGTATNVGSTTTYLDIISPIITTLNTIADAIGTTSTLITQGVTTTVSSTAKLITQILNPSVSNTSPGGASGTHTAGGGNVYTHTTSSANTITTTTPMVLLLHLIQTPLGSIVSKVVSTVGVSAGLLVVLSSIEFSPASISELFLLFSRWITALLVWLGIKKKAKPWGVVYDASTKQPLDPVYVVLRDMQGKRVASAVTDIDGRYGFLAELGTYHITANKTNYLFPSHGLAGKSYDEVYQDLYFGESIEIKKQDDVIIRNIAMDRVNFDWNEFAKRQQHLTKFYSQWESAWQRASNLFFSVGFVVAALAYLAAPYPYNTIVLMAYLLLLLLKVLGLKPRPLGYVTDAATGTPLPFAIVRIMIPGSDKEIASKVADQHGRYYGLVPKGTYYVKIEKKNDDGSYSLVYTSKVFDVSKKGIIKERFKV